MKLVEHLRTWDQIPDDDEEAFHWLNLKTAEAADLIEKQAAELAAARYADSILKSELRASQATSSFKEARRMQVAVLQEQLAAEQAYSAKLRDVIDQLLDDMGEDGHCVCPAAKQLAIESSALPHDESALREWGARLLDWTFSKGMGGTLLLDTAMQLRSGDWKP